MPGLARLDCSRYVVSWRSYRDPALYASTLLYRSPALPVTCTDQAQRAPKAEWWGITNECPHLNAPLERESVSRVWAQPAVPKAVLAKLTCSVRGVGGVGQRARS